jgi:hypothetical protein
VIVLLGAATLALFAVTIGPAQATKRARADVTATPVPAHVETWAVDDRCNSGMRARSRLVRRWLTYAETNCNPAARKARRDCRSRRETFCQVIQYLNTNWIFHSDSARRLLRAADDGWWLHEPGSTRRIYTGTFGGGYLVNQAKSSVRSFFKSYVRKHFNRDDGLLMDWQSPSLAQELFEASCGCRRTVEIRSSGALRAAHQRMSASMTHRNGRPFLQVDNSLAPNQFLPQGLHMLNPSIGVVGWSSEGLPESDGNLDPFYPNLLDQIAFVANEPNSFVVLGSEGAAGAAYQEQSRRVQEATYLLGYAPGHLVDWANLEQGSRRLAIWPEEGIYPLGPVQTMRAPSGRGCLAGAGVLCRHGGHNDLRVAHGVYRREFSSCYDRGVFLGACAAIVNTTRRAVRVQRSWLRQAYRYEITFNGGDVQSGGTIDHAGTAFHPGGTLVPADDALLLGP